MVGFSSKVECDELSSAEWKSDPDVRTYEYAEAIVRCGVLDGKSRAEIEDWMGESELYSGNRLMGWILDAEDDESSLESEYPEITIEKDRNNEFTKIYIFRT
jgi:hypothetical protein